MEQSLLTKSGEDDVLFYDVSETFGIVSGQEKGSINLS